FQAEDGIRYRNVTGVQTCALPIFICTSSKFLVKSSSFFFKLNDLGLYLIVASSTLDKSFIEKLIVLSLFTSMETLHEVYPIPFRSEERRVGKECRSRRA